MPFPRISTCQLLLRGAFLTNQLKHWSPPGHGLHTLLTAEVICLLVYVLVVCLPHPHPAQLECQQRESRVTVGLSRQFLLLPTP